MDNTQNMLVIGTDRECTQKLEGLLKTTARGNIDCVHTAYQGVQQLLRKKYALVFSEYVLDERKNGLGFLFKARELHPQASTILVAEPEYAGVALRAVAEGVFDYLVKPLANILEARVKIQRAWEYHRLLREYETVSQSLAAQKRLLAQTMHVAAKTREVLRAIAQTPHP
ncbi:MAG: response regulator [Candidatus Omnitrophica bacterium]|nr:response regulator [Candidatus Omnitrophota bacterium]